MERAVKLLKDQCEALPADEIDQKVACYLEIGSPSTAIVSSST